MLLSDLKKIVLHHQAELKKDLGISRNKNVKIIKKFVTIISGVRRSGKSTLVRQFLKNKKKIYYTYFEDVALADFDLKDFTLLEKAFKEEIGKNGTFFFDEIQNIKDWEKYIRQLVDKGEQVIITGSNASMLSKELGTRLTGRHLTIELYPFSYTEFLSLKNKKHNINLFKEYLKKGGFPEYLKTNDSDILKNLFEDIFYRDILQRNEIRNTQAIKSLINFLISNIGKETTYNKLKSLISVGSVNTVSQFMYSLEQAYLFFTLKKFDYSVRKQIINPKKIYCIDTGLININSFSFSENKGRILENCVFLELKRRGKEIFYYKNNHECDFLIFENNRIQKAIQVCYNLNDNNKEREIAGLIEAMEEHSCEGVILTFNKEDELIQNNKKILIKPVWQWLLEK